MNRAQKTKRLGGGATRKVAEMLKFPRKEEETKEKKRNGNRRERKEGERGKKEGEKCEGTEWVGILGKKKKVCEKK